MILSGSIYGYSIFSSASIVPEPAQYDTIRVFGNSTVDKVRGLTTSLTSDTLGSMHPTDEFEWIPETILLAEFNNSLSAGNIEGIINPIEYFQIYRRRVDDVSFTLLSELDVAESSYVDYEAKTNKEYIYRIFAFSSDEISAPLDADSVTTDFFHWSLTDPDTDTVYLFDLNLDSGSHDTSSSMIKYENTFTEHPYINHSLNKYISGSISAIAGQILCSTNGEFEYPQDYLDELETFIHNGKDKILKDRRGRGWIVRTDNFGVSYIDVTSEQLAEVSFDFTEVDNLNS